MRKTSIPILFDIVLEARRLAARLWLTPAFFLAGAITAPAALITLSVSDLPSEIEPGHSAIFTGTIGNNTGNALFASEIFLNFGGFDSLALRMDQLLGDPDFLLDSGTVSASVPLFRLTLDPVVSGLYSFDVFAQDVSGSFSEPIPIPVRAAAVPEPGTCALTTGALVLLISRRRKGHWPHVAGLALICTFSLSAQVRLASDEPEISRSADRKVTIGFTIINAGADNATSVQVTDSVLNGITQVDPLALPISVGNIAAGGGKETVGFVFAGTGLIPGFRYLMTVRGNYTTATGILGFALNRYVVIPPASGSGRYSAIRALETGLRSIPTSDFNSWASAVMAIVRNRPEFVESTIERPTGVWARFADGAICTIVYVGPARFAPMTTPMSITPSQAAAHLTATDDSRVLATVAVDPELPGSNNVRLLNAMGPTWKDVIPDLKDWLVLEQQYEPVRAEPSIPDLRKVGGDAVLYLNSHAGNLGGRFAVGTSTNCSQPLEASDPVLTMDIASDRVEYMFALWDKGETSCRYSITDLFVTRYWSLFAPNSLVFLDVCEGAEPEKAAAFRSALFSKGASVVASWKGCISEDPAADGVRLFFDRLVGANHFEVERESPQRPFGIWDVVRDVVYHRPYLPLIPWPKDPILPGSPLSPNVALAPSIEHVEVREALGGSGPSATISGIFGSDPGITNRAVLIDNVAVPVLDWSPTVIHVFLPASGPGSSGDVIVRARGHLSNVARITEWTVPFTYLLTAPGPLTQKVTLNLRFRADIRTYRHDIHVPPIEPQTQFTGAQGSTLNYTAGGSVSCSFTGGGSTITHSWDGGGTVPVGFRSGRYFDVYGEVSSSNTFKLTLEIVPNDAMPFDARLVYRIGPVTQPFSYIDEIETAHSVWRPITVPLDKSAVFPGGELAVPAHANIYCGQGEEKAKISWLAPTVKSPPDPTSAR